MLRNFRQVNDGFSDGTLEYRCNEKRGNQRSQQDDGCNSRVALKPVCHLPEIGANVDCTGRFALKHDHMDQDELTTLEPVSLGLSRGKWSQFEILAAAIAEISSERLAVERIDASRNDIGCGLQRRESVLG